MNPFTAKCNYWYVCVLFYFFSKPVKCFKNKSKCVESHYLMALSEKGHVSTTLNTHTPISLCHWLPHTVCCHGNTSVPQYTSTHSKLLSGTYAALNISNTADWTSSFLRRDWSIYQQRIKKISATSPQEIHSTLQQYLKSSSKSFNAVAILASFSQN